MYKIVLIAPVGPLENLFREIIRWDCVIYGKLPI